jgi:pimeloyl-ACP methyl ester carboxylesterase
MAAKMKKRYWIAGAAGLVAGLVATKLLTRPRDVEWADSLNLIAHPEYSWFTQIDGARVHYQEAGNEKAPPIILVHGFISSTLVWSDVFLPLAAAGFRVIAPDLLGCGYSDKPRYGAYTIEAQALAVVGLMDQLGIDKAILVGASYGGAITATIALDYPERVDRLVLVAAVSNNEPTESLLLRIARTPIVGDVLAPLFLSSRWALRARMQRMYRRRAGAFDERRVEARHHLLSAANTHRAVLRTLRRWDANRIRREAHLIHQPTLVVWGQNDPEIPLSDGQALCNALPSARLIVFRDCGHQPHVEFPGQFLEATTAFCRGTDGGR